jgi:hypothetical protein
MEYQKFDIVIYNGYISIITEINNEDVKIQMRTNVNIYVTHFCKKSEIEKRISSPKEVKIFTSKIGCTAKRQLKETGIFYDLAFLEDNKTAIFININGYENN